MLAEHEVMRGVCMCCSYHAEAAGRQTPGVEGARGAQVECAAQPDAQQFSNGRWVGGKVWVGGGCGMGSTAAVITRGAEIATRAT